MTRRLLLATTALITITPAASLAAQPSLATLEVARHTPVTVQTPGMTVLYNQNSNAEGVAFNSQNYTSGVYTSYNDQAADDFIIPAGQTWRVKEFDPVGCGCSGPLTSEDVYFFKDNNGIPGKLVRGGSFIGLHGKGDVTLHLKLGKKGISLKQGHYWVSVVANCSYSGSCGHWGWQVRSSINNDAALWRQPGNGGGTGCTMWNTLANCSGGRTSGDLMFELQGASN